MIYFSRFVYAKKGLEAIDILNKIAVVNKRNKIIIDKLKSVVQERNT